MSQYKRSQSSPSGWTLNGRAVAGKGNPRLIGAKGTQYEGLILNRNTMSPLIDNGSYKSFDGSSVPATSISETPIVKQKSDSNTDKNIKTIESYFEYLRKNPSYIASLPDTTRNMFLQYVKNRERMESQTVGLGEVKSDVAFPELKGRMGASLETNLEDRLERLNNHYKVKAEKEFKVNPKNTNPSYEFKKMQGMDEIAYRDSKHPEKGWSAFDPSSPDWTDLLEFAPEAVEAITSGIGAGLGGPYGAGAGAAVGRAINASASAFLLPKEMKNDIFGKPMIIDGKPITREEGMFDPIKERAGEIGMQGLLGAGAEFGANKLLPKGLKGKLTSGNWFEDSIPASGASKFNIGQIQEAADVIGKGTSLEIPRDKISSTYIESLIKFKDEIDETVRDLINYGKQKATNIPFAQKAEMLAKIDSLIAQASSNDQVSIKMLNEFRAGIAKQKNLGLLLDYRYSPDLTATLNPVGASGKTFKAHPTAGKIRNLFNEDLKTIFNNTTIPNSYVEEGVLENLGETIPIDDINYIYEINQDVFTPLTKRVGKVKDKDLEEVVDKTILNSQFMQKYKTHVDNIINKTKSPNDEAIADVGGKLNDLKALATAEQGASLSENMPTTKATGNYASNGGMKKDVDLLNQYTSGETFNPEFIKNEGPWTEGMPPVRDYEFGIQPTVKQPSPIQLMIDRLSTVSKAPKDYISPKYLEAEDLSDFAKSPSAWAVKKVLGGVGELATAPFADLKYNPYGAIARGVTIQRPIVQEIGKGFRDKFGDFIGGDNGKSN